MCHLSDRPAQADKETRSQGMTCARRERRKTRSVLALALAASAFCAEPVLPDQPQVEFLDAVPDPSNALRADAAYRVQVCAQDRTVCVDVARCMRPEEQTHFALHGLRRHKEQLASHFETAEGQHCISVRGHLVCPGTCCADTALLLLSMMASVAGLSVGALSATALLSSAPVSLPPCPPPVFQAFVAAPPLVVETCTVDNVSSYFFYGLAQLVDFADNTKTSLRVSCVPHVDFEACPPARFWKLSSLCFSAVRALRLGDTLEVPSKPDVHDPAPVASCFQTGGREEKKARVDAVLTIESPVTQLTVKEAFLAQPCREITTKITPRQLVVEMDAVASRAVLTDRMYTAIANLRAIKTRPLSIVFVLGQTYGLTDPNAPKELSAAFVRMLGIHDRRRQMVMYTSMKLHMLTVELTVALDTPALMYVHVADRKMFETAAPWAVALPSALLRTAAGRAQALQVLAPHTNNVHVKHACAVVESLAPGEEAHAALEAAREIALPATMTLLPCGCFAEDAWNTVWEDEFRAQKAFHRAGSEHALTHWARYPTVTVALRDSCVLEAQASIPRVVYLEVPRLWAIAKPRDVGYTTDCTRGYLQVVVQEITYDSGADLFAYYVRQIPWVLVPAVQKHAGKDRDMAFHSVTLMRGEGMFYPFYRCLVLHILHALAQIGLSAEKLWIHTDPEMYVTGCLSMYHHAVLAQLAREGARIAVQELYAGLEYTDDLAWLARLVAVGTPEKKGALGLGLRRSVYADVKVNADGTAEFAVVRRVENLFRNAGWHLARFELIAPHVMVFCTPPFPSWFALRSGDRLLHFTLRGDLRFVAPKNMEDYFNWSRGEPGMWEPLGGKGPYLHHIPLTQRLHVEDALMYGRGCCAARILEYVEIAVEGCGQSVPWVSLVFYTPRLADALEALAPLSRFSPARPGDCWESANIAAFRIFLCDYNPRVTLLAHQGPRREMRLLRVMKEESPPRFVYFLALLDEDSEVLPECIQDETMGSVQGETLESIQRRVRESAQGETPGVEVNRWW